MSQNQQFHSKTHSVGGHPHHASAPESVSAGLGQKLNLDTRDRIPNMQFQAYSRPCTPVEALKGILVELMHHYPHLQSDQIFKAVQHLRTAFTIKGESDVNFQTRFSLDSDRDLSLTIKDIMHQSQWSVEENDYLHRLVNALWHNTYHQIPETNNQDAWVQQPEMGSSGESGQTFVHMQSRAGHLTHPTSTTHGLSAQLHRHQQSQRGQHYERLQDHHDKPRRPSNLNSDHSQVHTAPTHTTPQDARRSQTTAPMRLRGRHHSPFIPQTDATHQVPSQSPVSTAPSEYDKWQPTDERYIAPRNPLFQHDYRSRWQKLKLNIRSLKKAIVKALKF